MSKRIDEVLVEEGFAPTRSQAKQLIEEEVVFYDGKKVKKAGKKIPSPDKLEIQTTSTYVGRGARKLEAAIEKFQIDPSQKIVADVGASTGGFTDYLLQKGAQKVYAIDVGHSQLAEKLRNNPAVINMEKTDIRDVEELPEKVDLAVVDLSFISLKLVLEKITSLIKPKGQIIILIKPQFEVGKEGLGKNGIVKDKELTKKILEDFRTICERIIPSPIKGKEGNQEYLGFINL